MSFSLILSLLLQGFTVGMLLFLIASGLALIFGLMGVLNFAHGSIFMWGAYVGLAVYTATGSFVLALLAGAATGAAIGALMEYLAIRPLYGRPIYQVLLTLGLMMVLDELVKVFWGPVVYSFPKPEFLSKSILIGDAIFPVYRLFMIGLGAALLAVVYLFLTRTRLGIIVRAGVEDSEMVQALGINARRIFTFVFALGGALAALGGVAAGPFIGVYPQMGLENQLGAFIVVVIGGIGSFAGSAVGSLLVGIAQVFVSYFFPQGAMALSFALMALVLLLKPEGLFGGGKRA